MEEGNTIVPASGQKREEKKKKKDDDDDQFGVRWIKRKKIKEKVLINRRCGVEAFDDEVRLCLDVGLAPFEHGSLALDLELENEHPNEPQDQLLIAIDEVCLRACACVSNHHKKEKIVSESVTTKKKKKKKDAPSPDKVSLMS